MVASNALLSSRSTTVFPWIPITRSTTPFHFKSEHEIQVLVGNRHKNMTRLNRSMALQRSPLNNWLTNGHIETND